MNVTIPDLSKPLVVEPEQTNPPAPTTDLGPLEHLVGTWTNSVLADDGLPYSFNLMPLPQNDPATPDGYILKNFAYYEEITFSAIHGNAPNRGGSGTQVANTLFYEQRVYFAEGPDKDKLVHAENGSFLYLTDTKQILGPYAGQGDVYNSTAPTQPFDIVKQISVPHGNSILAVGTYSETQTAPSIPSSENVLPIGVGTEAYHTVSVGNPNPAYTLDPSAPLKAALNEEGKYCYDATSHILLQVSSNSGGGMVSNIGFEQDHADVTTYHATYWLEAFNGSDDYTQLQYTQTILMDIPIPGKGTISFPHITTNTLTKVSPLEI